MADSEPVSLTLNLLNDGLRKSPAQLLFVKLFVWFGELVLLLLLLASVPLVKSGQ